MKNALGMLLFGLFVGVVVYFLFPRKVEVHIPKIETVYDTVETVVPRLDTLWRTRTVVRVDTLPNLIDTITVQAKPETVFATSTPVAAICPQRLQVGEAFQRDKPTIVEGKTYTYDSTRTLLARPWTATYFTTGPLDAMVGDTFPPLLTFRPAPQDCNWLCRLKLLGIGAVGGTLLTGGACLLTK
jgi:hypothetical protein